MSTSSAEARARFRLYAILLALGAALLAQAALDRSASRYGMAALGAFLAGGGLLSAFTWHEDSSSPDDQSAPLKPVPGWRRMMLLFAVPAGIYAWQHLAANRFTWDGTLAWLATTGLVLLSAYQAPATRHKRPCNGLYLDWIQVALLGAVAVGAFLRLWRLEEIPAEMGCDLPHNYNNILGILNGQTPVFFTSWPGREGLLFYLAAIPSALFGLSHWSIKLTTALVGIATIPLVYLLGRELYERELGLIAAWLYAASHWAIITSRTGLRMSLVPALLCLTLYFFVRGLHRENPWLLAVSGFFLGLGMHSYNAFMVVPPLLVLLALLEVILGRGRRLWRMRWGLAYLLLAALAVFIPLARFMYDYPGEYLFRVSTRLTSAEVPLPGNPLQVFAHNVIATMLMFNVAGDQVSVNNIAGFRQLGFIAAALLPLGAAHLVLKPKRGHNLELLVSLLVMLLPTALSLAFPNEVPNAGRAIGALPLSILVSALGLDLIRRGILPSEQLAAAGTLRAASGGAVASAYRLKNRQIGAWALVAILLASETISAYPLYFDAYRLNLPDQNYSISLEIARVMDDFAGNGEVFIKTQGNWYDGNAVRAQLRKLKGWNNEFWELDPNQPPVSGPAGKVLVIFHPADTASIQALRTAFTESVTVTHFYYDGREAFIAFYGER